MKKKRWSTGPAEAEEAGQTMQESTPGTTPPATGSGDNRGSLESPPLFQSKYILKVAHRP